MTWRMIYALISGLLIAAFLNGGFYSVSTSNGRAYKMNRFTGTMEVCGTECTQVK